jgi:hypothetical protein
MKTVLQLETEYEQYLETGEGDPGDIILQLFTVAYHYESKWNKFADETYSNKNTML